MIYNLYIIKRMMSRIVHYLHKLYELIKDPSIPYLTTVRYKHKIGKTIWIKCRDIVIRDKDNKSIRIWERVMILQS